MRGCSGADEYEAGKEKKSQYTHYKKLDYTTVAKQPSAALSVTRRTFRHMTCGALAAF